MEEKEFIVNEKRIPMILKDIKYSLQEVYDNFRTVGDTNEYLRKENERLKSEQYKDEELARLKEENEKLKADYYRGFPISEEEKKKIDEWKNSLPEVPITKLGAIGGRYIYEFTPTSIGVSGTIRDSITGRSFEFQELS